MSSFYLSGISHIFHNRLGLQREDQGLAHKILKCGKGSFKDK